MSSTHSTWVLCPSLPSAPRRSSRERVCRGDLSDTGLELGVRKDCRGSGVDETGWWPAEGSTSQGSRVRRACGVQAEWESEPFLSSSQFVLLPIAGCLRQADRQTDLSSCVADAGSCSAPVSAAADGGLGPRARPDVACQLRVVFTSSDVEKIKRNTIS